MFALWYQLDEPLTTVIGSEAMAGYLRLFRLLWVIKRVEHTLSSAWQMMNNMQRQLAGIEALQKETGVQSPGERMPAAERIHGSSRQGQRLFGVRATAGICIPELQAVQVI